MPKVTRFGGYNQRSEVDLGGLTALRWTRRPHMGPFNEVSDEPLSRYPGDEPYRQHDIEYGKLTNPYLNFNAADENLLRSPASGWPDYVAKGVFYGKKVLDIYNTPSIYKGGYSSPKKDVYSKPDKPLKAYGTYDAKKVPWRFFPDDTGNWRVNEERRRSYGPKVFPVIQSLSSDPLYPGKRPPGWHPGLGPGGTRAPGKSKHNRLASYVTYS